MVFLHFEISHSNPTSYLKYVQIFCFIYFDVIICQPFELFFSRDADSCIWSYAIIDCAHAERYVLVALPQFTEWKSILTRLLETNDFMPNSKTFQ